MSAWLFVAGAETNEFHQKEPNLKEKVVWLIAYQYEVCQSDFFSYCGSLLLVS